MNKLMGKPGKNLYYGFSCLSRQHYGADYIENMMKPKGYADEIVFGIYAKKEGCKDETAVRWLISDKKLVPRFEIFTDSLELFYHLYQVLHLYDFIKTKPDFTPDEFARLLINHKFVDLSDIKL